MYHRLDHGDTLSDLFMMIERNGPLLMLAGGCGLTTDATSKLANAVPSEAVGRFAELLRQGKSIREIADLTGWPYPTVCKHTRQFRKAA